MRSLLLLACLVTAVVSWATPADQDPPREASTPAPAVEQRTKLNLLGQTDAQSGESRRNENIQFNLVDRNLLRDLNTRQGTTATIVTEFAPDRGYYGAEYGNQPTATIHVEPGGELGIHGRLFESHLNSIFSARSFFQVGGVQPARENNYGADLASSLWGNTFFSFSGSQQRARGMVNGNVLVPLADERTPLATDPTTAAYVARILAAYPAQLPNRTDIDPRMLNTNSPQEINSDTATARIDRLLSHCDRLVLRQQLIHQRVLAFQFIKGQNPDTTTRSHQSRITWIREQSSATTINVSLGFDRLASQLAPANDNLGPQISVGGLSTLGPNPDVPLDRAENMFRHAAQLRHAAGHHQWTAGYDLLRRYLNGYQDDSALGSISFQGDPLHDAITNMRLGEATKMFVSVGDTHRRFRNWDQSYYAGDKWQPVPALTVTLALRYQPVSVPTEANHLTVFPYRSDCNNVGPLAGVAWRLPGGFGVVRAGYGLVYDNIVQATYQQLRYNPPGNLKLVINDPYLPDPVGAYLSGPPSAQRNSLYILDPNLVAPYSNQYNFSWEPAPRRAWRLQLGYVGSRTAKIIQMLYTNRARVIPGVPLTLDTIDERRPDAGLSEVKDMLNGSFAWFDAARATLVVPQWKGLSISASYWFSKALDLGANYSDSASNRSQNRSQTEFESHHDLKGLSDFDQPHSFLARASYQTPVWTALPRRAAAAAAKWNLSAVVLLKSGTPFLVQTGSDAPGYGNVDGASGDRPNLLDPWILGRTIGNPDTSAALLPRSAFSFIAPGALAGNLGRNVFRKGPIENVNASLARRFAMRGAAVELRAESINVFNTPQFAAPGASLANSDFGMITNTLNEGRTWRFQLGCDF